MALGKLKHIDNTERKFGATPWYWFTKVKASGRGEGGEEYWLVTEDEAITFAERGLKNPEDNPLHKRGIFLRVANTEHKFGEGAEYIAVQVYGNTDALWLLTENDLEQIRVRVEENAEDIAAHKESWLADLLD